MCVCVAVAEGRHHESAFCVDLFDAIFTAIGFRCTGGGGVRNRATPLAAGGGTRDEVVGGGVAETGGTDAVHCTEFGDDAVFDHQICILNALDRVHLLSLELSDFCRQNTRQSANVVNDCLHAIRPCLI